MNKNKIISAETIDKKIIGIKNKFGALYYEIRYKSTNKLITTIDINEFQKNYLSNCIKINGKNIGE